LRRPLSALRDEALKMLEHDRFEEDLVTEPGDLRHWYVARTGNE
jgi:hypothetical protein